VSAKPKSGLGRGMDSLISNDFNREVLEDSKDRIQKLFITQISPMSGQPRTNFDDKELAELAESIKNYGILQPLIVSANNDDTYTIIAGERRWRASQLAGLDKVPAIVRNQKEQERLEIALIENVQRVDLSPLEQAVSIERLRNEFGLGYAAIAKRLGKAVSTVNNMVRLLQLPENALIALQKNEISEGHARAILALKDSPDKQDGLLKNIIAKGWSVRQAEQFVIAWKQRTTTTKNVEQKMAPTNPRTESLSKKLTVPVTIKRTARGGRLEIHFKNDQQLEAILKEFDNL